MSNIIDIKIDLRKTRIANQKEAFVKRLSNKMYVVLDGGFRPMRCINDVLQAIHRRNQSANYAKGVAYDYTLWARNAGHAGVDALEPPRSIFESFLRIRIDNGLSLQAAHIQLSRLHKVFKHGVDNQLIVDYPYPTKEFQTGIKGKYRRLIVPDLLPASPSAPLVILPSSGNFRAHYLALVEEAKLPAETLQKTGLRIFELEQLEKSWPTRQYAASGTAVVEIEGKGRRLRNIYVPPDLAQRLDIYLSLHGRFLRADGSPWTTDALSAAFRDASALTGVHITAHMFRHSYGSWAFYRAKRLFEQGKLRAEPLLIVQVLLGHASWETTANIYCNIFAPDVDGSFEDIGGCPIETLIDAMEPAKFARKASI
jgi:integrase